MAVYFTSDTHFGHGNIIKYCGRPFKDVPSMNRSLIYKWNSVVKEGDTVFHLGDVAFMKREEIAEIIRQLNGYKILLLGNHDRSRKAMLEIGFDEVYNYLTYDGWELGHLPPDDDTKALCGHVHTEWKKRRNTINVGCDVWGFIPRTIEELIK